MTLGSWISLFALHFTQYASILTSLTSLLTSLAEIAERGGFIPKLRRQRTGECQIIAWEAREVNPIEVPLGAYFVIVVHG
jgi:hypothetical protein